jgi:hypothetical protein
MPKGVYESALRGRHERTPEMRSAHAERSRRHGLSGTPTYDAWCSMVQRCTNPRTKDYPTYGGRGITVCAAWMTFDGFLADMGEKPAGPGVRLARIELDGNYEPGNCRWQQGPTRRPERRKPEPRKDKKSRLRDDPEYSRWMHIRQRYGLGRDDFADLLAAQDGQCYLCGEPLDVDRPRTIHIDHDHSCCRGSKSCGDCVRGLACEPCNKGIGTFGDDPERMRRVADALEMANRRVRSRGDAS